jgi:hypothetical protein
MDSISVMTRSLISPYNAQFEERLAHFHIGLGVLAAGDNATVVVQKNDDGYLGQVWMEHTLATGVEAVAVDQLEYRWSLRHGCACCW